MTISTEVRKAGPFIGNGSASVFPFAFKVFKAADLIVVRRQDNIGEETTLILDSDYHVTLNSNQDTTPGGIVTLVAGVLASGFTLVVSSELSYLQPTDLTNQGGFYPKVITNALDRLTIFCQQLLEITGRTLKLPITAPTNISAEIPLPNPSELIAWNETGTGLTTISPQSLVTSIAYGSATADLFAGDGATTTFPLSTNPASVNNLDVSVGGFSQRPVQDGIGDYSWNGGASITFVVPPPAPTVPGDKNVLVRYMQAIPVSDSEALHAQTREALRRSYAEAGCTLVAGSFETGGTLTAATDVLLQESTGAVYAWTGALPKTVAPGFDPTGIAGFDLRTGGSIRGDLASVGGVALVGNASARCNVVSELKSATWLSIGKTVETTGYHNIFDGGGCTYHIVSSVGVTFDEANYIALANPALAAKAIWPDVPNAAQFGCKFDGSDSTSAMQKAVNHGGVITVGDGEIGITSIDLRGKSVYLNCAGPQLTKFNGLAASVMFNAYESADVTHSPFGIVGCTIDGKGLATTGIKNRFRHKTEIDNLIITGCVDGLYEVDSWNNLRNNITIHGNTNGLVCAGANNNCNYRGISIYGNSGYQLKILDTGGAPGGSTSLSFTACDIEFATGDGVYMDTASTVPFFSCYIGEQIQGKVFDIARGKAVMHGGFAYWGTTATSYLAYCVGGDLHLERVTLTGGSSASLSNIAYSGNGRLTLDSCDGAITITDAQVMTGETIGYGKQFECFAPKLGRKYTGFCLNGTFTEQIIGNGKKVTVATSTGSPTLLELHANLTQDWVSGGQGYLVVTYKSSKPCSVRLTSGPIGNTPSIDIAGTLPATTTVKTAVLLNWTYTDGVYPTIFEIFQNASVAGDTLELIDVYLSDSRMSYSGAGSTVKSLSKC